MPASRPRRARGFALIVTIVLVAFLVLILVGLATFTRVETQVAGNNQQLSQARQNALMALNLAVGELQRAAGPDQRVTAPSNLGTATASGSDLQPHLTGVWRHEDPGAAADLPTRAYSPKLVSWLVSGNENMGEDAPAVTPASIAALPEPAVGNDVVWLVNDKTVEQSGTINAANPDKRIRLNKTPIRAAAGTVPGLDPAGPDPAIGHYAWWVGDEGVKARINVVDPFATTNTAEARRNRLSSNQIARGSMIDGFKNPSEPSETFPDNQANLLKVMERSQFRFAAPSVPVTSSPPNDPWRRNYHAFTAHSVGLLTDTRQGGLRHDLSYLASLPATAAFRSGLQHAYSGLSSTYDPGAESYNVIALPGVSVPAFFPAPLTVSSGDLAPTWEQLHSFMRMHLDVSAGQIAPRTQTATRHGAGPVLVQAKLAFGIRSTPSLTPDRFNVWVHYFPLIVLGNPHSVALAPADYNLNFRIVQSSGTTVPSVQVHRPAAAPLAAITHTVRSFGDFLNTTFQLRLTEPVPAGEARVFSLEFAQPTGEWESSPPSYAFTAGADYLLVNDFSPDVSIRDGVRDSGGALRDYTAEDLEGLLVRTSAQTIMGAVLWNNSPGDHETVFQIMGVEAASSGAANVTATISSVSNRFPGGGFMQRHSDQQDGDGDNLAIGYFGEVNQRAPVLKANIRTDGNSPDGSAGYPLLRNGRVVYDSRTRFDGGASRLTVRSDMKTVPWLLNHQSGTGPLLDSLPVFHVPRTPHVSLGQLQHFNATAFLPSGTTASGGFPGNHGSSPAFPGGNAPTNSLAYQPPYIVGHSRASKFIERDALARNPAAGGQHQDTSFLLNTALWDRFYFSSIDYAAETSGGADLDFGRSDIAAVNRRYRAILEDGATLGVAASSLRSDSAARRLQILGAFNVNSTSKEAWKAFLGSALGVDFNSDVTSTDVAFPRHLDLGGTTNQASAGVHQNAWSGFRKLTEAQIDTLAGHIVAQVKLRGPFLSLSDFVNRRIIAGDDIGIRGALEEAIRAMNLNAVTLARYSQAPPNKTANVADNAHARPHLITDYPGWLTQADLLQPLAPAMTARSDTFVIRTYGDVRNPVTEAIEGRAWCEAIVQRLPDYVDAAQAATTGPIALNNNNRDFGRRFAVVSFRWLGSDDL